MSMPICPEYKSVTAFFIHWLQTKRAIQKDKLMRLKSFSSLLSTFMFKIIKNPYLKYYSCFSNRINDKIISPSMLSR